MQAAPFTTWRKGRIVIVKMPDLPLYNGRVFRADIENGPFGIEFGATLDDCLARAEKNLAKRDRINARRRELYHMGK